ncbi:GldG family protein, partial [Singulisphaera rosea]
DVFADNTMLALEPTNQDVLMNAIGWLRGRSDLQGIAPKTHVSLTLAADPVLRARLIMVPTVMAVLLIVALGIATYVARRE